MVKNKKTIKIMLSGGGTGGSVTPLLAVAEELIRKEEFKNWEFVFVGTKTGPEKEMVDAFNAAVGPIKYLALAGGKFRRYISLSNFFDVFKISAASWQAFFLLSREKPDIVVSAGSFVSVPLIWLAALKKIPVLIHQEDVRPGLANRLMAPFARVITVTFAKSLADYGSKAVWIGNPIRPLEIEEYKIAWQEVRQKYNLEDNKPLILLIGGSIGAKALNDLMFASRGLFSFCQIIHLAGSGKLPLLTNDYPYYYPLEFLPHQDVLTLMIAADLIISRCGLGVLTELSYLHKAAILIPIPDSHQEDNAAIFARAGAAIILKQAELTPEKLVAEVKRVLGNAALRTELQNNIGRVIKKGAAENMAGIIEEIVEGEIEEE
jgi:UDP-N-acetylglucosamine--N-acetylmuramyl-(pentapeptide) pyrophosphoryl-undecaprenol N-acetylglucosamine transferase